MNLDIIKTRLLAIKSANKILNKRGSINRVYNSGYEQAISDALEMIQKEESNEIEVSKYFK